MTNIFQYQSIRETARLVGGTKLFAPQDAKELVRLLIADGRKILGIDGIFQRENGFQPSMEDSLLTEIFYKEGLANAEIEKRIIQFIDSHADIEDLLFEIVIKHN